MAAESLNNPFSGYGVIVSGERFVGRFNEIDIVKQRVLGDEFSNLSITGLPRSGKSSLLYHCLMEQAEELAAQKTIVVYYVMGSTRSALAFYRKMADKADQLFHEYGLADSEYERFVAPLVGEIKDADLDDVTDYLERFFKRIRSLGYKLIYILDEFDKAQDIFEFEDYQYLREVSHDPNDKICLITCSRKTLDELEVGGNRGDLSSFAKIFKQYSLNLFDEDSVEAYWDRVEKLWPVNDTHKKIVHYLVGNHPWLMDVVNDYFFINKDCAMSLDEKVAGVKLELMQGLDHMIKTIDREHLLDAAIQLVMGPMFDVTEEQEVKLLKYGFLRKVRTEEKTTLFCGMEFGPTFNGYSYICFSDYCSWDFYRRYYANVPYSEVWSETENMLRNIIKCYLDERYTDNWEDEMRVFLLNNLPNRGFDVNKWSKNVGVLQNNRVSLISTFPQMQGQHIVDFTLTSQLFDIFIKWDWGWFGAIFNSGTKTEWFSKFDHLSKVRNPVAHNNNGDIRMEMETARRYCLEIKNAITAWQRQRYQQGAGDCYAADS